MSSIQFWLSFDNGAERLRLPVNPASISVRTSQQYNDVNVSQLGEVTVFGDENLAEFEFSSFFPTEYSPVYCEYADIPAPWDIVRKLETWQKSKEPCQLIITGTPINTPVTIRSFDYDAERAGNVGDIYYTLTLKEYKFIEFKTVTIEAEATQVQTEESRPNPNPAPTSYKVVSGDSLSAIAAKLSSKGVNISWNDLYNANKATIGKNPNLIYPGQELVIPN